MHADLQVSKDSHDEYRDFWASLLMDMLNSLPDDKRKWISISFVEPVTSGTGFRFPGDFLRYDIVGLRATVAT